jgi:NADPH-dependent 2,4-dienoyl-CoA reductase/sulfur reductase-like enzyme/rhodanese-related sulfurtransferase
VLATGATPAVPGSLKGRDLKGVFTLTKLADATAIMREIGEASPRKAVVVGAGLIGLEAAEALRSRGLEVSVVEALGTVLPAVFDPEMAAYAEKELIARGVSLRLGQRILALTGDTAGHVRKAVTEKGEMEADLVVLALGARPNVQLARDAGLAIGTTGGIAVNEHMQTDDPDIYAGGDCVENVHRVTGAKVLAPMGSTANKHGRVIGTNLSGGNDAFPGVLGTAVVKVFETNLARTGLSESEARTAGFTTVTSLAPGFDRASYYPGAQMITVKLVVDAATGRILGGQMAGRGDVARRADVLVSAISLGASADDVADLDLAYSPPFNGAMDVLHHAANVVRNKMTGRARAVGPAEVNELLRSGADFVLLDVRSQAEWDDAHIEASQCQLMPLNKLREKVASLPRDTRIVTMCRTSVRAYQAQRMLEGEGFTDVCFMDGSILAWPYAVVCKTK